MDNVNLSASRPKSEPSRIRSKENRHKTGCRLAIPRATLAPSVRAWRCGCTSGFGRCWRLPELPGCWAGCRPWPAIDVPVGGVAMVIMATDHLGAIAALTSWPRRSTRRRSSPLSPLPVFTIRRLPTVPTTRLPTTAAITGQPATVGGGAGRFGTARPGAAIKLGGPRRLDRATAKPVSWLVAALA